MEKHVFICEENIENIFTGIFDAFSYRNKMGTDEIDIVVSSDGIVERQMFCDYEKVETNMNKAFSTADNIRMRLGEDVYEAAMKVACHYQSDRAYVLFRFLELCFKYGRKTLNNLTNPYVMRTMELARKAQNESHLYLGITRFQETYGILCATIEPKCNAIPLIVEHFADRYPGENWLIYDKTRNIMAVHRAFGGMELVNGSPEEHFRSNGMDMKLYDQYEDLWKVFFESIAIKERENPTCQRNLLPLWMRTNMNEFKG